MKNNELCAELCGFGQSKGESLLIGGRLGSEENGRWFTPARLDDGGHLSLFQRFGQNTSIVQTDTEQYCTAFGTSGQRRISMVCRPFRLSRQGPTCSGDSRMSASTGLRVTVKCQQ